MAFALPDDLNAWVGYEIPSARAQLLIEAASASVVEAAGVPITAVTDDTATLDGNGSTVLLLPSWPVTAVGAVTVAGTAVTNFTWTRAGELRRPTGWPRGSVVVVTYSHGHAETPATIKSVTLEVAARGLANPQGYQAFQTDGTNAQFSPSMLELTVSERDRVLRALG